MCVLLLSGTCYVPDYVLQATPIEESQLLNVDGIINSTGVIVYSGICLKRSLC